MTNSELLIAKRIMLEMIRTMENGKQIAADTGIDSAPHRSSMAFFMGMGMALAIVFEEITGKKSMKLKPREIIEWAKNLPQPEKREPLA